MEAKLDAGLSEISRFLALRAPFEGLAPHELGELAAQTEIEFHRAGAAILTEDGGPVTYLRVIHSGGVDLTHEGRLLDLLETGDTFGQAAMMAGLPPGFEARASEDTLCYRIPVAAARPLLERARDRQLSIGTQEPNHQAVAKLLRSTTVRCAPETSIAEVARLMTEAGANSAIVDLADRGFGILTDRDLRMRVVAAGLPSSSPVSTVMTTPVFTVTPDQLAGEVLFELLERGLRHAPVVSESGALVGVIENADLFSAVPRSSFGARRAIARAKEIGELAEIARALPRILVELRAAEVRAQEIGRVHTALLDAVIERALELAARQAPLPADGVVWVAVGSHARRELTPGSTISGAVVYSEPPPPGWMEAARRALAACSVRVELVTRATGEWAAATPADDLALGVLFDRRPLFGTPREPLPSPPESSRAGLVTALKEIALAARPPTGFDADAVLVAGGARRQRIDIRVAAVAPITLIGRWAGAVAGLTGGSTPERLSAGAEQGAISQSDAQTLIDAFELAFELRLAHHMDSLSAGEWPDDLVEPAAMSPLARDHLRDVFRAIASVQRRLSP